MSVHLNRYIQTFRSFTKNEQYHILKKLIKDEIHKDIDPKVLENLLLEEDASGSDRKTSLKHSETARDSFDEQVLEAIPGILFVHDLQKNTNTFINNKFEAILGSEAKEVFEDEERFLDQVHPDDRPIFEQLKNKTYKNPDFTHIEYKHRVKDSEGEYRWVSVREVSFKRSINGELIQTLGIVQDITDSEVNRLKLKKLLTRNQMILNNTIQKFFLLDIDGKIIAINKTAKADLEEDLNVTVNEGDYLIHYLPQKVAERFSKYFKEAVCKGRVSYEEEIKYNNPEAKTKYWNITLTKVDDPNAGINDVIVEVLDFTEEKKLRGKLEKSRERFEIMAEGTDLGVWEWNTEEKYAHLSDEIYKIIKYTPEDVDLNKDLFLQLAHPEDHEKLKKAYLDHSEDKLPYSCDFRIKRGDNQYTWVRVAGKLITNGDGFPKRMVGSLQDVNNHKVVLEKLKQRESLLTGINQNINEGIYQSTQDAKLLYANTAFANLFGYDSPDEITGRDFSSVALYVDPEDRNNLLEKIKNKGVLYNKKVRYRKKNGTVFWALLNTCRVVTDNGSTIFVGAVRDVTNMMEMEQELYKAKDMAEEMNRLKSNFLANMSHEIRTPINGILGLTQIMNETEDLNEMRQYADLLNESGTRLLNTINSILDLAKLESEKGEFTVQRVNINRIFSELDKMFALDAKRRNIYFEVKIDYDNLIVLGDDQMIKQILINLIGNAVKFTHEGGITLEAEVKRKKFDKVCIIRVTDTGIGISKEFLPKVFDEFRQERTGTKNKYEGTGLGMAISKRYAELLGGKLEVESEKDQGSVFSLTLPCV